MARRRPIRITEYGDLQTPLELAARIVSLPSTIQPRSVIEPTCGAGAFLSACVATIPDLEKLVGLEINTEHLAQARCNITDTRVDLIEADIFTADLGAILETLPDPLLAIGNPPWVTAAQLGRLHSENTPARSCRKGLSGLDALTGRSNFDVSEWIVETLVEHLAHREATLRFVVKTTVARRILEHCMDSAIRMSGCTIHRIDAAAHFNASVDACVLTMHTTGPGEADSIEVFDDMAHPTPSCIWAMRGGRLVADADAYDSTAHLAGPPAKLWRSGVKHDCTRVMVLTAKQAGDLEPDHLYPLVNATDVARGRPPTKKIIITQTHTGQDTDRLRSSPRTWRYLNQHADELAARKSRVYRDRPPFSIFGVGPYSFAPYKVAVSALHPDPVFRVLGPVEGKPVIPDDTVAFIGCDTRTQALGLATRFSSPTALKFITSQIFEGMKRPITISLLDRLDPEMLI